MNKFTEQLKKLPAVAAAWLPDTFIACGGASLVYGVGLIYLPAGYIVGGVLALVGGVLMARGAT
ncbi:hypothetical protein [Rhodoferax sp. WC2427]|uniref:hypothetical protein n=1 Tax=Rhodoferax sp. WC2427 TaxID=3234144 RepID=UPI003464FE8B